MRTYKYFILIVFILLLVLLSSIQNDVVYVNDNNMVVQVNDNKLYQPRPISKYDLECKILHIKTTQY